MTPAAAIFTGSLALTCQMDGETSRLVIDKGHAEFQGMEDTMVELGLNAYRDKAGSIRMVAVVRRENEFINWAMLRPDRARGGYSMTWYTQTRRDKKIAIGSRGHCDREPGTGRAEGSKS